MSEKPTIKVTCASGKCGVKKPVRITSITPLLLYVKLKHEAIMKSIEANKKI